MKNILIFILSLSFTYSFGCSCATPDTKEGIAKLISDADIVVEGTPYSIIKSNKYSGDNQKKEGVNLLFDVTSIIKGNLNNKVLAINQEIFGGCAEYYKIGNRYLLFGYEIKGFQSKKKESNNSKRPIDLPPGMGEGIDKNGIFTSFTYDKIEINYWEKLLIKYRVFTTSSCSTFEPNSDIAISVKIQQLSTKAKKH
ncbi:hypothetical protein [Adhaeribacter aquaticus]|uniref:hypothetical protein n=1 Tax=Adhaeribacter aquaticus TaxID=299567 RepID=UPI0004110B1C|nr:hypothetical protein [Adhaeribacter aquaticus]